MAVQETIALSGSVSTVDALGMEDDARISQVCFHELFELRDNKCGPGITGDHYVHAPRWRLGLLGPLLHHMF